MEIENENVPKGEKVGAMVLGSNILNRGGRGIRTTANVSNDRAGTFGSEKVSPVRDNLQMSFCVVR